MTHLTNANKIRTIMTNGYPWFALKDLCNILKIDNNRNASARLDEDEKGVHTIDTHGGAQNLTIVSEIADRKAKVIQNDIRNNAEKAGVDLIYIRSNSSKQRKKYV